MAEKRRPKEPKATRRTRRRKSRRQKPDPSPQFASTEARHTAERFGLLPTTIPATGRGSKITVGDVIRAATTDATDRTLPAGVHARGRVHKWPVSKIPPWAPKFLDALILDPNVSRAAAIAGIGRQHAYAVREKNADFAECWDEAVETAVDALESEVRRRALDGVTRPIYQGGRLVGFVREHSDHLAGLLLKAHRPQKYRDVQEIQHKGGLDITAAMRELSDGELQRLAHAVGDDEKAKAAASGGPSP
jgi:pyruvate/2-oxoglutarate dehydrogenase complex dihydrolipoamide acyltransferase (E2) component